MTVNVSFALLIFVVVQRRESWYQPCRLWWRIEIVGRTLMTDFSSMLWRCWLGVRKEGIQPVKQLGVGLLMVTIWLELCASYSSNCHHSPPPSSLAPVKSRMYTFWYQLTQVHLEKWPLNRREKGRLWWHSVSLSHPRETLS